MNNEIQTLLHKKGANIVRFVDISSLSTTKTQGFTKAIVFLMALSREFIRAIRDDIKPECDEFVDKEHAADGLADWIAEYLQQKGFRAYSQSEESNWQNGNYDDKTRSSRLPHKTIARLAGLGLRMENPFMISLFLKRKKIMKN